MQTRTVALITVLAALCLAIQLSPRPPNVEFTSFLTFTAGAIFGSFSGVLFGCFIMFINGFLSPWGFAGLNMPFQMVGMGIVGLAGGLYKGFTQNNINLKSFVEVAVLGAFLTVIYDFITNLGVAILQILSGVPPNLAMLTAFASGALFSFIHVFANFWIFQILFVPLFKALSYIPGGGKIG